MSNIPKSSQNQNAIVNSKICVDILVYNCSLSRFSDLFVWKFWKRKENLLKYKLKNTFQNWEIDLWIFIFTPKKQQCKYTEMTTFSFCCKITSLKVHQPRRRQYLKFLFSRLPYPVGKSSTIDESFLWWFCGSSVVSYSISISIRVLDHSRTFYRNS